MNINEMGSACMNM